MRREKIVQLVAALCMLGFLAGAGLLTPAIASSAGRHKLVYTDRAEDGDRNVAMGVAMGAFKGLFVNWLWIRANQLKEDGKYHEAMDLAKAITRLQPHFPKVWAFHGWNLAYNISVATSTPEERWNWVQAGIRLLRSEGIKNCPTDLGIHKELAWILQHKVQGYMDDAHRYYKRRFADEWASVLGPPPMIMLENQNTGQMKERYVNEWIGPVAEAPETEEELYERVPAAQALVAELKSRAGLDLDAKFLRKFAELSATMQVTRAVGVQRRDIESDPLLNVLADERLEPRTLMAVVFFTRRRVLERDYNMEPARMVRYTLKYGPLDWRHPSAHALYWSARGVEETLQRVNEANKKDYDILNTDRITIQSVQELFRTGWVTYDILNPDFYMTLPNVEFIDKYREILRELAARSEYEKDTARPYRFYWAGYENFMRDAVRFLYRRGDRAAAEDYLKRLRNDPQLNVNNEARLNELALPLDEFVRNEIAPENRETNPTVALQEIAAALQSAYVQGLLAGNPKLFRSQMDYARSFHAYYQDSQAFHTWVSRNSDKSIGRLGFPEFETFAATLLAGLIESAGLPQGPIMYQRAPAELQGRAYALLEGGRLYRFLQQDAKPGEPGTFQVWFPEPEGVDRYRKLMRGANAPDDAGRVEQK